MNKRLTYLLLRPDSHGRISGTRSNAVGRTSSTRARHPDRLPEQIQACRRATEEPRENGAGGASERAKDAPGAEDGGGDSTIFAREERKNPSPSRETGERNRTVRRRIHEAGIQVCWLTIQIVICDVTPAGVSLSSRTCY